MERGGRAGRLVWTAWLALVVIGCATQPVPSATTAVTGDPNANLTISGAGFTQCGEVPAYACVYAMEIEGPDGVVHQGWFDYPKTTSPTLVSGDIPTHLDPGSWRFTFRQERVSDTVSFEPVPTGTPRAVRDSVALSACETSVTVRPDEAVSVFVDFAASPCVASWGIFIE